MACASVTGFGLPCHGGPVGSSQAPIEPGNRDPGFEGPQVYDVAIGFYVRGNRTDRMAARNDKWETVKSREDVKRKKRGGAGETVLPAQEQANRAFAAIDR